MKYAVILFLMPLLSFGQLESEAVVFSNWQTDYNIALKQAKKENKHLLVYFIGGRFTNWYRLLLCESGLVGRAFVGLWHRCICQSRAICPHTRVYAQPRFQKKNRQ